MQIKLRGIHPSPTTPSASNSTIITTSHLASSRLNNPRRPPTTSITSPATPTRERICFPAQPVPARPSSHTCTEQAYQDPPAAAPQHHHARACLAWAEKPAWRGRTSASDGALACFPTGVGSGASDRRCVIEVPCRDFSLRAARLHRCGRAGLLWCQGVLPRGRVWLYYITGHGGLHFLSRTCGLYSGFETRLWRIDKVNGFSCLVAFSPNLLLIRPLLFFFENTTFSAREREVIHHGD